MELQCDICFIDYDLDSHRPKSLPCGHTICKECVQRAELEKKCPTCWKELPGDLGDLPDTILAIRLIENGGVPPRKKPRREDSDQQRLQRGVDAGRKVVEALRLAVPKAVEALNRQLDASVAQLRQLEETLEQVQRGAAGDGRTSQEQLQLATQLEDSLGLLNTKCSVVAEEEDGSTWKAAVQIGGFGDSLRLLLLQLRADGQLGKVDDVPVPSAAAAYVGPPIVASLTISEDDMTDDHGLKVNEILLDKRRLENIRCITGLEGEGSDRLLRVVASHSLHVEELVFSAEVGPKVMEEVLKLPSLKRLDTESIENRDDYPDLPLQLEELKINGPSEQQLDCVMRMPALYSLTVLNYLGANLTFPPSDYGTLRWLGVSFHINYKPTMLSLIRAHASSLQELQVSCSISEDEEDGDYYFPELGQDLAACDLLRLRRLVLERDYTAPCEDAAGCLMQRQNLRGCLPRSVEVVCDACRTNIFG
ncbi:uncharacterized protein LOC113213929 [Frankliniella occidentalis]|uniref:Uncharacterized protein LOC113213929 n=1 Tax=Frankliniella occidentalis TaxID=133901 RepID=A0A6J1TB97_FRAOC|nr:uncharacterized protein LOC113213929 [Frankliniella occidentalis]